jgi:diadenylate cyclase
LDFKYISDLFQLHIADIIDILLFATLLYLIYNLVKGTGAIRIFIGIILVYIIWKVVKAFHLQLISEILGQFISVGVIALIVVFQPEIRQFLLAVGTSRFIPGHQKRFLFWKFRVANPVNLDIDKIVKACQKMADTRTGALIVIAQESELTQFVETGQAIDAKISSSLLETIFFRNSPLHDGAVIIVRDNIRAARCILPVSNQPGIPAHYGLRHRSALGITEKTDAIAIVVSEERGQISYSYEGKLTNNVTPVQLDDFLEGIFNTI